jgi:WD40 repeat protein
VSASEDSTLRLWEVSSGTCLHVLSGAKEAAKVLVLSEDGCLVLSAAGASGYGGDRDYRGHVLHLWDGESGRETSRWTADAPITACEFSSSERRVVVGDLRGRVHFLSVVDGEIEASVQHKSAPMLGITTDNTRDVNRAGWHFWRRGG